MLGDFLVKKKKKKKNTIWKENLYLTQIRSQTKLGRNEMWCAEHNHNHICNIPVVSEKNYTIW